MNIRLNNINNNQPALIGFMSRLAAVAAIIIFSGFLFFAGADKANAGTYYVGSYVNGDPCEPGGSTYCDPTDTGVGNDTIQYQYLAQNQDINSFFELYYGTSSGSGSDQASGGTKVPPDTADCSGSEPVILNGDPTIDNAGTSYAATWDETNDRVVWNSSTVKINAQYVNVTWNLTFCSEAGGNTYDFDTLCTNNGGDLLCGTATYKEFVDEWGIITVNPPTIETHAATGTTDISTTLNATTTATGGANLTARGFAIGTSVDLSTNTSTTTESGSFGTGDFYVGTSTLNPGTTYYFRAYGTNSGGTGYGSILNFTTDIYPPTIETHAATGTTYTSSTLNATTTATGGANLTARGFAIGTSADLSTNTSTTTESGSFGTGDFYVATSTLNPSTTYYFRAYGTNSGGTGYGNILNFTTDTYPPTIETHAATGTTDISTTLNATTTAIGGANLTARGFAIGTSADLSTNTSTTTESGSFGIGDFYYATSTLNPGTTYYFRAYGTNPGGTSYGSILSFTSGSYTQSAYRFYENIASTSIGTALTAAQDQTAVLGSKDQAFRLRTLIHVASTTLGVGGKSFSLHFAAKGGGTCESPTGSYATVTPATVIAFNDNDGVADGDTAVASSTVDPEHGTDLTIYNSYEEDNNFTSIASISDEQDGLWDFALKDNGSAASTTYCFKIVKATDSSDLYNYSVYPEITTRLNTAPTNDSLDLLAHNDGEELYAGSTYTWRVLVTDTDGYDDVNLVILQLDYDGTSQDITWTRSSDTFSSPSGYFSVDSTGADSNNAGNQWTLDFKLTLDWDWADTDDTPTDAQVVSDDLYYATTTNAFLDDTFQVENDLRTTSITFDSTQNPGATFSVSGYLDYEGVTTPNPPEDIADIRIDPNWSASNYDDIDLEADGYFSVSGVVASSTLNNTDTFDVDILNAPSGAGAISSDSNTMDIDRVQITNIVVSNHAYDSGTRYWDPNADSMTATISAILERGAGAIVAGTSTIISNSFSGGASANIGEDSTSFSAGNSTVTLSAASYAVGSNSATYDDLDITSISASTNSYGTAYSMGSGIDEASEQPDVGWDDVAPTGGALAWGTITSSNIDVTPSAGADADSGLPTNKYYMAYDQATTFSVADANSGWVNSAWSPGGLSANLAYAYVVKLVDNVGNEGSWVYPSPVYKFTLGNIPTTPGHSNQAVDSMRWTWASGGAETDFAYGTDTNCLSGTTTSAIPYWNESSLSANTSYTRYACARNAEGATTSALTIGPFYTSANVPTAPTVNNPGVSTLDVNPNSGGSEKNMAIYMEIGAACDGSGGWYITAGGATTTSAVWQTEAAWATVTVTNLSANIQYSFCAKATNENDDETAFGSAGSAYSGANTPITPGHESQTVNSMRWTWASGGAQTDYAYGTDSNCTSGNTSNTYWDEGSLSANTSYTRYACGRNADTVKSASLTIGPFYTSANTPNAPSAVSSGPTSINVDPASGGSEKNMALYMELGASCDGSGGWYITAGGATTTSAVWQTEAAWSTVTVNNLSESTQYSFCVKATNENDDETGFGASGSAITGTLPAPYRFEGGFNIYGGMTFY